jgi:lipocalin
MFILVLTVPLLFLACSDTGENDTSAIPLIPHFDLNRYMGTWYEIARLPHRFEKNLTRVTATYSLLEDGKVKVVNRGFNLKKNEWSEANAKAWVPDPAIPVLLRVNFFWIFAADYRIIDLEQENYAYAMVTSSSKKYFWILSRTPNLEENIYNSLMDKARQYGFETGKIEKVPH